MKRGRFSEEQIIRILKEHQAGLSAADLCRKHGISDATFYKRRSKYGGMEVSDAKRLKGLEEENRKLKKLLAEQVLDNATLKTGRIDHPPRGSKDVADAVAGALYAANPSNYVRSNSDYFDRNNNRPRSPRPNPPRPISMQRR
jgi:putative transposase